MSFVRVLFVAVFLLGSSSFLGARASAQDDIGGGAVYEEPVPAEPPRAYAPVPAPMPAEAAPRRVQPEAPAPQPESESETESRPKKKKPMNGYAFGIQLGVGHVSAGDVRNPTYVRTNAVQRDQLQAAGLIGEGCSLLDRYCQTDSRRGVQLSFPIQVGGPIVGFKLEPYFTLAASAKAYGVYMGPTFDFQVARPVYLGFGFGLKAAWVNAEDWKYALDIYGRVPMRVIYYFIDNLALVVEFGIGGGASGYVSGLRDVRNPVTGQRIARRSDMTLGVGRSWDFTVGFRFP